MARLIVHPDYTHLTERLRDLPHWFDSEGEVIYDARNQLRRFQWQDAQGQPMPVIIKRFHQPAWFNQIAYSFFRPPKACRSYDNALYMLEHGVGTPAPIAYLLSGQHLLKESYLVTRESQLKHLHREFTLAYTPALDQTIRPLARFTAHMHNEGILHLDFSPGNILWDYQDGEYRFELIDLNRMRIGREVTLKEGCCSLRRLCARTSFFSEFAREYASARGLDPEACVHYTLLYRDRFWNHGRKAHYQYD